MSEYNEWETSSGLSLDGASVTVDAVEFGFNANIGANVLCANFTFTDDDGETHEQSFTVGKGWDASRDGSELVSESGKPKAINKNTNFGILIDSAVAAVGDPSVLGGSPRAASTWIGTRWEMGTVKVTRLNPTTGIETEKDVFVFRDYLGRGEDAKAQAKPAAKAAGKTAAAASNGSSAPADIDEALWAELVELARTFDEHDDFVEAALDLDGVEGNKAASKAVMGTRAGSVWAAK